MIHQRLVRIRSASTAASHLADHNLCARAHKIIHTPPRARRERKEGRKKFALKKKIRPRSFTRGKKENPQRVHVEKQEEFVARRRLFLQRLTHKRAGP